MLSGLSMFYFLKNTRFLLLKTSFFDASVVKKMTTMAPTGLCSASALALLDSLLDPGWWLNNRPSPNG